MKDYKTLIICVSFHHGNSLRIAEQFAKVLDAKILTPNDFKEENLDSYDLIGFGSGIYNQKHHSTLINLINKLTDQHEKKAFVFSTSTIPVKSTHVELNEILLKKGFSIIGDFTCKGFMDYSFTKHIFKGLNKGRPNAKDLKKAEDFALQIEKKIKSVE